MTSTTGCKGKQNQKKKKGKEKVEQRPAHLVQEQEASCVAAFLEERRRWQGRLTGTWALAVSSPQKQRAAASRWTRKWNGGRGGFPSWVFVLGVLDGLIWASGVLHALVMGFFLRFQSLKWMFQPHPANGCFPSGENFWPKSISPCKCMTDGFLCTDYEIFAVKKMVATPLWWLYRQLYPFVGPLFATCTVLYMLRALLIRSNTLDNNWIDALWSEAVDSPLLLLTTVIDINHSWPCRTHLHSCLLSLCNPKH